MDGHLRPKRALIDAAGTADSAAIVKKHEMGSKPSLDDESDAAAREVDATLTSSDTIHSEYDNINKNTLHLFIRRSRPGEGTPGCFEGISGRLCDASCLAVVCIARVGCCVPRCFSA